MKESINETPYELGGMKVYSKADGLKKVKSMQKTDGAKIYKVTKTKTKLYGKHPVTMYNLYTKNKNHSTRQNPYGLDMMKGVYLIPVKESVNEEIEMSKGVKKLMKIADTGFAKVGGVTVDGMSANLFKQIYNKANDDIKQKLNTKNEKQLVRILGGMWQKFGKNVTIGSSL